MDSDLFSMTTDDLQVQPEQLRKAEVEEKALKLLKRETLESQKALPHLALDYHSYQKYNEKGYTGFMHVYVNKTANPKTMTTSAKRDVMLFLAKFDLLRDQIIFNANFSEAKFTDYTFYAFIICFCWI